jgi:hypothetical protein
LKSESLNGVKSGFPEKKGKKGKIQLCLWGEISPRKKREKKLKKNKSVKGTQIKAELFQPPKNEPLEA